MAASFGPRAARSAPGGSGRTKRLARTARLGGRVPGHPGQPADRLRVEDRRGRRAEVQGEACPLPRQQRHGVAAGEGGEGRRRAEEVGEPLVAVEGEDEAALGEVEGRRREMRARGRRRRGRGGARRRARARRGPGAGRGRRGRPPGRGGRVHGGLGHAGTVASRRATRARSSGTSSASNQGLRLSQAVLRQDGCGSGSAPAGGAPVAHGRRRPARRAAQVPAVGIAADEQRQPDGGHGGQRAGAPGGGADRRRRQVGALGVVAGEAEGHGQHGEARAVVEGGAVDARASRAAGRRRDRRRGARAHAPGRRAPGRRAGSAPSPRAREPGAARGRWPVAAKRPAQSRQARIPR